MKKRFARKAIKGCFVAAGIIVSWAFLFAATETFAEEMVKTSSFIDEKKIALNKAQEEYDEALINQQAARDVVVNAERALEDAQEIYDDAMEKYRTGFAGFLQWVINTESDSLKVEDAKLTLEALNYDNTCRINGGEYLIHDFMRVESVSSRDITNITRMYNTIPWIEALEDYYGSIEGCTIRISFEKIYMSMVDIVESHVASAMGIEDFYNIWSEHDEGRSHSKQLITSRPYDHSHCEVYFSDHYSYEEEDEIPANIQIEAFPDELFNSKVMYKEEGGGDISGEEYVGDYIPTNIILGISAGTFASGANFVNWRINDGDRPCVFGERGEFIVEKGTYSLREYIDALKEYYDIVNPENIILAYDQTKKDLEEAQRTYDSMDSLLMSKLARLKDVQREYEEAVALFKTGESVLSEDELFNEADMQSYPAMEEMLNQKTTYNKGEGVSEVCPIVEGESHNEPEMAGTLYSGDQIYESKTDVPLYTERSYEYSDIVIDKTTDNKQEEKSTAQYILAEVISYIFNGGAIAFIIPMGVKRRKTVTGIPV